MGLSKGHIPPEDTTDYHLEWSESGQFMALAFKSRQSFRRGPTKRGRVSHFSRRARGRMFKQLAKVPSGILGRAIFLTLTYPLDQAPAPGEAKRHLERWAKRFRKKFPRASAFWKLEPTKNAAPHFHLLVFGLPAVPIRWASHTWYYARDGRGAKGLSNGVDIDRVRNAKSALAYAAKYIAKVPDPLDRGTGEVHDWTYPGRWWGVVNREYLPVDATYWCIRGNPWFAIRRQLRTLMAKKGRPGLFEGTSGGWVILPGTDAAKLVALAGAQHIPFTGEG